MTSTLRTALVAVLVAIATACVVAPARAADPPAAVPLDSGWQFRPAGGTWRAVDVPHVFDARPLKSLFGGTTGTYRLTFTAPAATAGFQWGVRFEQARRVARVLLNGRQIGTSSDPYVPFTLPASGLRAGARNTLVVELDNRKGKEPREGWWNWGGLTRPVSLVPRGALELRAPGVMSDVHCASGGADCRASVRVDGWVVNRSGTTQSAATVTLTMTPPGGGTPLVARRTARTLAPGETARVSFEAPVSDPQLWSPGRPALYDARLTTSAGDSPTQQDTMRVGLREVRVDDGLLTLNGRVLNVRGASIQEDVDGHGPALTDADVDHIVDELKAVHANVTRAHYLLDERLLDKLDAAGIMVWSQAPIYHRDELLRTPQQRKTALATLRGTVLGARSHPSVITHSVANELSVIPDRVPGTRAYLDAARMLTHDLDPTLPVSVDLLSYPGYGFQQTYAKFDLFGINSYFGWYPGKKNHSTANIADLAPFLDHMRVMYPRQAMLLTEFGAESTFDGPPQEKESYAFQSQYVRDVLKIVEDRPFLGGAIYWTLREFAVKPDWDGGAKRPVARDSIHHKGLITYDGRRKPAWDVAEQEFADTPLFRNVSWAQAHNVPAGAPAGSAVVVWGVVVLVVALLALDAWALVGILGVRAGVLRRRRGRGAAVVRVRSAERE